MSDDLIIKILTHLESMNDRLQGLETDISGIKASQTLLETTLNTLNSNVDMIQTNVDTIQSDVDTIRSNFGTLQSNVENLQAGQTSIENDIAAVKTSQLKLESNLTNKIEALFDGWQQHEDYAERNTRQLDRLEGKIDKLELAVTNMAAIQGEHSDLLNGLTATSATHETEILALKRAK